jgi:hypothetical protein
MKMRAVRLIVAALLVVSVSAGTAGAASISAGSGLAGSATTVESTDDKTASAKASANFTGAVNGSGVTFVWECDVVGIGLVAATSMKGCYLETNGARYNALAEVNLPGNVVASAGTKTLTFAQIGPGVRVCVEAEVLPIIGQPVSAKVCVEEGVGINPVGITDLFEIRIDRP